MSLALKLAQAPIRTRAALHLRAAFRALEIALRPRKIQPKIHPQKAEQTANKIAKNTKFFNFSRFFRPRKIATNSK